MPFNFPALAEKKSQLKALLDKVPSSVAMKDLGDHLSHEDLSAIRRLNVDIDELEVVKKAAEGARDRGEPGAGDLRIPGAGLKRLERLTLKHSVGDWVKARDGGRGDLDADAGWDAYAKGLIFGDWQPWLKDFGTKAMSTSEPGGGYLVPDVLSSKVIDRLRATAPIFAAGATTVPMSASTLDIARVTGDPTTAWHAESAAITPGDVTLDRVRFTARTLPVLVKVSRELAEDAPNLGAVVTQAIAGATGNELTRVALRGSGTPPEPQGILNQSGVALAPIGVNGGALTHDLLIDAHTVAATANVTPNAMIWHPRTAGGVAKFKEATTLAYMAIPSPVAELAKFTTTTIPANLTKGTGTNLSEVYLADWTQLLIGMRTSLRIQPLNERYADTGEVAFLSWMRADVQLEHGAAFVVIPDVTT